MDKLILTRKDIEEQREQMQEDVDCILDGLDDKVIELVCQVIVDRCNILIDKGENK
jgi:hypothetical protein